MEKQPDIKFTAHLKVVCDTGELINKFLSRAFTLRTCLNNFDLQSEGMEFNKPNVTRCT